MENENQAVNENAGNKKSTGVLDGIEPGEILVEFREFMASHGIVTCGEIIPDGKRHRFHVEGDSDKRLNGWYILHIDERPAGRFGAWNKGPGISWSAKNARKLSTEELRALQEKISAQKKIADAALKEGQARAKSKANRMWPKASPPPFESAYLTRKGISKPIGARFSSFMNLTLIPMRDENGELWNLQCISGDGGKNFLSEGRIEGLYCTLASAHPNPAGPILICEGYATGSSIFAATDLPTVVAFNTANLPHVAKSFRKRFPKAAIVICADNDAYKNSPVKNPGITYGKKTAEAIGAGIVWPEFARPNESLTDFNDLHGTEGLGRVAELIEPFVAATLKSSAAEPKVEPVTTSAPPSSGDIPAREPIRTPIYQIEFPHKTSPGPKGKPLATIENIKTLIENLGISTRYDVIKKDNYTVVPGEEFLVDTEKSSKLTRILSYCTMLKIPTSGIADILDYLASTNPVNPVAEWISGVPWDGTSRLQEFYSTVRAFDESDRILGTEFTIGELKQILMGRWMVSAIAAAFNPKGVSAHGILVFRGDQYIGKTKWFKSLVPEHLGVTADGVILDPKDKDLVYQSLTNWLVELGEIDGTLKKSDPSQLKAFITKDKDTLRRPYSRKESNFARRTVFFASVNPEDYLSDPTGNRRFWTVNCEWLNLSHGLDMQQVFAEFLDIYRKGESWYLTGEEMGALNAFNKDFESMNPIADTVVHDYDWTSPVGLWRKLGTHEIAHEMGMSRPTSGEIRIIVKAVRNQSGNGLQKTNGKRYLLMPPRNDQKFTPPKNSPLF